MQRLLETTRRPDITFCPSGRILITSRITKILALNPGDSINIACDKGEFLLYSIPKGIGRRVATCYPSKKNSRNFCCNSVKLCRAIFKAAGIPRAKASFMIGDPIKKDNTIFLPVITRSPLSLSSE